MRVARLSRVLVAAALSVATLSACSANDDLANQFRAGDNKNYISGDGSVTEIRAANRAPAVKWSGTTVNGAELSSQQLTGVPVVLNFWYAGCAPCRAEAPDLVKLAAEYQKSGVQFVGVNVRDTAATALAFARTFKMHYPSIIDANQGSVLLAFTGVVTPQAVPSTLIIDKQGRVSARILGRIEPVTLKSLIDTVVGE
jgi:thiol-disulfide isomerase/thioredoxin